MNRVRWVFSFVLAFLLHGGVLAGFFLWHPSVKRHIIYSPSFAVSLFSSIPERPKPVEVKETKPQLKPQPKPEPKPQPKRKEPRKQAWKVKEKKPPEKLKKPKTTKKVVKKTKKKVAKASTSRKKKPSKRAVAARERVLLAKALAKVSREVSLGGGGVGREAIELRYKAYYDEIWRRVKASWILPEEVVATGEDLLTVVIVRIGRGGELLEIKLEESSGNKLYDQSCLRAVKKSAPFPHLPEDYPQRYMELGLRFRPWE